MEKKGKKKLSAKAFTGVTAALLAVLLAFSIALPVITTSSYDLVLRDIFGETDFSKKAPGNVNANYYTRDITDSKELQAAEQAYTRKAGAEGFVLLYNKAEGGKGRDLGDFAATDGDRDKHYLEPDSVELGVIQYLNDNFDNVIIVVNTNNAFELGWVSDYENISAVLWAPGAGGDLKLTGFEVDAPLDMTNPASQYFSRQAIKHILYTTVNSNAMNGIVHGTEVGGLPFANYYFILIGEGIAAAALMAWGVTAIVRRWKKEKRAN